MEGRVLNYDKSSGSGLLIGEDKARYPFRKDDWKAEGTPVIGQSTDFVANDGSAIDIYPLKNRVASEVKSHGQQIMENKKTGPTIVYVCYLLSFAMGISLIIGGVFAYIKKDSAPEWIKSHYRYQIRTFWNVLIGSIIGLLTLIIGIGAIIICIVYIWLLFRIITGWVKLNNGEVV